MACAMTTLLVLDNKINFRSNVTKFNYIICVRAKKHYIRKFLTSTLFNLLDAVLCRRRCCGMMGRRIFGRHELAAFQYNSNRFLCRFPNLCNVTVFRFRLHALQNQRSFEQV